MSANQAQMPLTLYPWQVEPTQRFMQNPHLKGVDVGFKGGGPTHYYMQIHRRAGKDVMAFCWAVFACMANPGYRVLYVHKKKTNAYDNVINATFPAPYPGGPTSFEELIPKEAKHKINRSRGFIKFGNNSMITFTGADTINVRGSEINMAIYSEVDFYSNLPEVHAQVAAALDRAKFKGKSGGVSVYISTFAGPGYFWDNVNGIDVPKDKKGRFLDRNKIFRLNLDVTETEDHNGEPIMPEDKIKEMVARGDMSQEVADREFYGKVKQKFFGAVFPDEIMQMRKTNRILSDIPIDTNLPVSTSWDLGSGHPTVIIFWQRYGAYHRAIDLMVFKRKTPTWIATQVEEWGKQHDVLFDQHYLPWDASKQDKYGNDESGDTVTAKQLIKDGGLSNLVVTGRPARKPDATDLIRTQFPSFQISEKRCRDLLLALTRYKYAMTKDEREKEMPERNQWASDYVDAVQSFVFGIHGKTILKSIETDSRTALKDLKLLGGYAKKRSVPVLARRPRMAGIGWMAR